MRNNSCMNVHRKDFLLERERKRERERVKASDENFILDPDLKETHLI